MRSRYFAGAGIEDEPAFVGVVLFHLAAAEVEQTFERSRDLVERTALRNKYLG